MTDTPAATTPMMAQYLEVRNSYPDCLLFYRMGDFYEMFFEDALKASRALDITLTKRGQHNGEDIPMCGVPVHSHESYLLRLIRQGFKVAICEQMEDPAEAKKRPGRPLVKRDVIRVVTPGTLTEDTLLEARANNYLAALADVGGANGLAWLDLSTGQFVLEAVEGAGIEAALSRLEPGEILLPERLAEKPYMAATVAAFRDKLSILPDSRFDSENARLRLLALYGVGTLDAFGSFSRAELAAAGALVDYVDLTQRGKMPHLAPPQTFSARATLEMDAATRRNLELTHTLLGERKGSLLSTIDRTLTAGGARLLASRLAAPLTDSFVIRERHAAAGFFMDAGALSAQIRTHLRAAPDMERALSRISLGRGGPRDLAAVRDGLSCAENIKMLLVSPPLKNIPPLLTAARDALGPHADLIDKLKQALAQELPVLARDGGFIAPGFSAVLDDFRMMRDDSRRLIAALQSKYAAETGLSSLKIKHNNIIGFHVEVTATTADKLMGPDFAGRFIHRQTMANAVRFTTTELAELERKISESADRALAAELEIFERLAAAVMDKAEVVTKAAAALAELDVAAALADLATEKSWCLPDMDDTAALDIVEGRHPVVEAALAKQAGARFIPNNCVMEPQSRLWLLTGPNMAGKSTFLRQNALIVILAQAGFPVPAKRAKIGIVDRLFSRVGAADDLARGQSTFMVEMVETATILNRAGPKSLVILDEIGRGTATFDGLSIAWACVEHLHEVNKCRALFATHYHELTALAGRLPALSCHTMKIREWGQDIVFLHEVGDGAADRSYGIHVARLAGLPTRVILRAEEVLRGLEQGEQSGALARMSNDLPLFSTSAPAPKAERLSSALEALKAIAPDTLSPREALEELYKLKGLADAG